MQGWTETYTSPAPLDKFDKKVRSLLQHTDKLESWRNPHREYIKPDQSSPERDIFLEDDQLQRDVQQESEVREVSGGDSSGGDRARKGPTAVAGGAGLPQRPRTRKQTATVAKKPTEKRGRSSGAVEVVDVDVDEDSDDVPLAERAARKRARPAAEEAPRATVEEASAGGPSRGGLPSLKKPRLRKVVSSRYVSPAVLSSFACACCGLLFKQEKCCRGTSAGTSGHPLAEVKQERGAGPAAEQPAVVAEHSAEAPAKGAATPPPTAAPTPAAPPAADDTTPAAAAPEAVPSASAAPTATGSDVPGSSGAAAGRDEDVEEIPRAPRREEGAGPFRVAFGCVRGGPPPEFV